MRSERKFVPEYNIASYLVLYFIHKLTELSTFIQDKMRNMLTPVSNSLLFSLINHHHRGYTTWNCFLALKMLFSNLTNASHPNRTGIIKVHCAPQGRIYRQLNKILCMQPASCTETHRDNTKSPVLVQSWPSVQKEEFKINVWMHALILTRLLEICTSWSPWVLCASLNWQILASKHHIEEKSSNSGY